MKFGNVILQLKKYSPQILIGGGIIFTVTGVVLACRATLKAQDDISTGKAKLDEIGAKKAATDEENYPEKDYKKEVTVQYLKNAGIIALDYAPAVGCVAMGIGCFVAAYRIEHLRYLGTIAAYNGLQDTFLQYRQRVIEDQGKDKDKEYLTGSVNAVTVSTVDENGVMETVITDAGYSPYARFFDSSSVAWTKSPELNLSYCIAQQNAANDLLHRHGHIFLNEVYDMLGLPRSQAGAVVGWVLGNGDDYVDFGIYNPKEVKNRDFVNGYESVILLDFNVDGVIYDKI